MSFTYRNHDVRVYQQEHRDYPPWVAMATRTVGRKVRMWNVEGQTMEEAAEKARRRIDSTPNIAEPIDF